MIFNDPFAESDSVVSFYAFITSFSDSMNSSWNEEQVYGRPDPIGTFQNTTRKISLAFDVPAGDIIEAKINLQASLQTQQQENVDPVLLVHMQ